MAYRGLSEYSPSFDAKIHLLKAANSYKGWKLRAEAAKSAAATGSCPSFGDRNASRGLWS